VQLIERRLDAEERAGAAVIRRAAFLGDLLGDPPGELLPPRQVGRHVADPPARGLAVHRPVELPVIERAQPDVERVPLPFEQPDGGPLLIFGAHAFTSCFSSQLYACGKMPAKHASFVISSFSSIAGLPAQTPRGGTFVRTTLPAPTSASAPISTPGRIVLFAPIRAPFRTTPPRTQSRYAGHTGCGSS